eukprot:2723281-Prymnesium_polylepis.1
MLWTSTSFFVEYGACDVTGHTRVDATGDTAECGARGPKVYDECASASCSLYLSPRVCVAVVPRTVRHSAGIR